MLCLPTGEVVAATDSSYVGRNLIQEAQADPSATSGARDLERAFANHETVTYSYQAERGTGSVCLREVPGSRLDDAGDVPGRRYRADDQRGQ